MPKVTALSFAKRIVNDTRASLPIGPANKPSVRDRAWAYHMVINGVRANSSHYWRKDEHGKWTMIDMKAKEYLVPDQVADYSDKEVLLVNLAARAAIFMAGNCEEMTALGLIKALEYFLSDHCKDIDQFTAQIVSGTKYTREKTKAIDHDVLKFTINGEQALCDAWIDCASNTDTQEMEILKQLLIKESLLENGENQKWNTYQKSLQDNNVPCDLSIIFINTREHARRILALYQKHFSILHRALSSDEEKILLMQRSAQEGNVVAQYNMGVRYWRGIGVVKNECIALSCLDHAVRNKSADASYYLYHIYNEFPNSGHIAIKYLQMAAQFEHARAQFELGVCLYNGQLLQKDVQAAIKWWTKSAEQGYGSALYYLGLVYYQGIDIPQDYKKAARLWYEAAKLNYASAKYHLSILYRNGQGVDLNFEDAAYWCEEAAIDGYLIAQRDIAYFYEMGEGVKKNYSTAEYWYQAAIKQKDLFSILRFAMLKEYGVGVKDDANVKDEDNKSKEDSLEQMVCSTEDEDSIHEGDSDIISCSSAYDEHGFISQDLKAAFDLYLTGCELDCALAYYKLAYFYEQGYVVERNYNTAAHYYRLAVLKNFEPAQSRLDLVEKLCKHRVDSNALTNGFGQPIAASNHLVVYDYRLINDNHNPLNNHQAKNSSFHCN